MMIPFNDIYSIARDRDNEIHRAANPGYGDRRQPRELRRTIAGRLRRLLGNSPAGAAWDQAIEPGR
jgi:hypothetical protein